MQDILKEKMDAHMILQGFELFLPEYFHNSDATYAQLCGYISGGGTVITEKVYTKPVLCRAHCRHLETVADWRFAMAPCGKDLP